MAVVIRDDPLLELARGESRDLAWLLVAIGAAAAMHVATAIAVPHLVRARSRSVDRPLEVIEIDIPKPPPAPRPPPAIDKPKPEAAAPAKPVAQAKVEPAKPAAQAAAVLTRAPDPNEPLDLTGGFVTGASETYAGGSTSSSGTSAAAVHGTTAASGAPTGTGHAPAVEKPAPTGPDRSKRPTLAGGAAWRCSFPPEADTEAIDHAVVTLRVEVDAMGTPRNVTVTSDPGHGFGREARRCALEKKWSPALDHDGSAIAGSTLLNVRFDR